MTEAKELRLALVLNGGVSLAVWISGVVHEVDRLRRAKAPGQADTGGYTEALGDRTARVDVIAGASAGGINGALLAAAIQGGRSGFPPKPLRADRAPIRDVWLRIGDLAELVRPANAIDPPSLLKGDEYFLEPLEHVLGGLLAPAEKSALDHPLYLYLTATALRSRHMAAFDTSADTIHEPDHRVVFRFSAKGIEPDTAPPNADVMSTTLPLDSGQTTRLARAARATSSFPAAFPPHEALLLRPDETVPTDTYLADGGILDNQPFGPVLDRVSVMPVTGPWRRVLLYVVPYVTEEAKTDDPSAAAPGIAEVVAASGLSRDLPKLTSLERVEAARVDGVTAARVTEVLHGADIEKMAKAAEALLGTYRDVQARELSQTIDQWVASPPSVGTGALGGDETQITTQARIPMDEGYGTAAFAELLPTPDWDTAKGAWRGSGWCWGLSKADRFARGALRDLGADDTAANTEARERATEVLRCVRMAMKGVRGAFYEIWANGAVEPSQAFKRAYEETGTLLKEVDDALTALLEVAPLPGVDAAAWRERLAATEVVANVAGTRPPPPPAFDFYRVSAKRSVLGHEACTPEEKLAGMQLGHFAAFMKRSWRANDWMWGRLDGIAWLGLVLGQDDGWVKEQQRLVLREELVALGKAVEIDEREHYSATGELSIWRLEHEDLLRRLDQNRDGPDDEEVEGAFLACKLGPMPDRLTEEAGSRAGVALVTRLATVASRALSGAGSGLPGPARGAIGTTRRTIGLTNSIATTFARAPALGIALVVAIAALAVVLALTGSAIAWITPALVAIALLGAWTGFGWISSPPGVSRALVLAVLLAGLTAIALATVTRDDGWAFVWWLALATAVAGFVLWVLYAASVATTKGRSLARAVRPWLGYTLLVLLAASLAKYAWDRLTTLDDEGTPAWLRWFDSHKAVEIALIVFVVGCLLLPLGELLAGRRGAPPAPEDDQAAA